MTILPPVAGVQAGHSTGGGLLDSVKNMISGGAAGGAPAQVDPGPKGDGSVGLFDGVLKKALFGGAAGAAIGFLPFIPGGPILGGVMGALGGAAMGVFSNWTKMKQIKQENEAMLAAMGVQVQQPEIQQVLQSGQVSQLIPMMQQAQGTTTQVDPTQQQAAQQQAALAAQQQAIAQGQVPAVVDPSTAGIQQSPVPTQGSIAVGSGATGAINPNMAVDPGIAPANLYAQGGGGSAGDVGRPAAPAGVPSADVTAIAPKQAGVGIPTTGASDALAGATATTTDAVAAQIAELQKQIDLLQQMLIEIKRKEDEEDALAAQVRRAA
jgi:hypothetical protein